MKHFLRFIAVENYYHRFLHIHLGYNQLRLNNMFSTRSHLLRSGLKITKNINRSVIPKTAAIRQLACSYFSVKVDVEGEIVPPIEENIYPQQKKIIQAGSSNDVKPQRVVSTYLPKGYNENNNSALVLRLKALSKSTLRDPCVIQAICNQLLNNDQKMNIRENIDILYCLSVLNVHNEELIMKVLQTVTALLKEIYKPSPLISSISKSMRNLLVRRTETLNGIIDWFQKHGNSDMSETADFIQTLAVLNYFPASADILLQELLKCDMVEYSSSIKYLNFVWAVTLIDRVRPEMAESVLVSSFRKKIESLLAPSARYGAYLKLINIHDHANTMNFKIKMDSNWYSTENTWMNVLKDKRQKDPVIRSFIDGLANLLPPRTFNTFLHHTSGCIIDAVCFFDTNHRPISELEFVKEKKGIKLALLVLSYKDLCSPDKTIPNGIIEFHKRCLSSSGYKILCIKFNEFPAQESLRKKSSFLMEKIQTVLPKYVVDG